mgnify:CR=1 FL=1
MVTTNTDYKIVPCNSHFTVLYHGQFMSSADTIIEAENDIDINEQNQEQEVRIAWVIQFI